jgi:hypothetical protein
MAWRSVWVQTVQFMWNSGFQFEAVSVQLKKGCQHSAVSDQLKKAISERLKIKKVYEISYTK